MITDDDLHAEGLDLLRPYRVLVTGSHPEYESLQMMDALDGWMRQGGRLMYLGGNGFYWRIAYHPTRPGTIEVRRSEDGTRAWDAEVGEYYHSFTGEYGGLWRRNNRAPQALAGVGFISQGFDHSSYYRRTEASHDPRAAFIFDGVPEEILGDFGILQGGAAGLEIDCADPMLGTPPHALVVARSENHSNTYELVNEEVRVAHGLTDGVINQQIHADMVFFETQSGGAVFSTGSIAYAGSFGHRDFDNPIARLTWNVLRRFVDPTPFAAPECRKGQTDLPCGRGVGRRPCQLKAPSPQPPPTRGGELFPFSSLFPFFLSYRALSSGNPPRETPRRRAGPASPALPPRCRSSTRRILPEIVFGSSENSSRRTRLNGASVARRCWKIDSAVARSGAAFARQRDIGLRHRHAHRIGRRHDRGLGHRGMFDQRAFQFERADPVVRCFEHVVGAADIGVIAVRIARRRHRRCDTPLVPSGANEPSSF